MYLSFTLSFVRYIILYMYKTLIDSKTLYDHLGEPKWVIVDCRFDLTDINAGKNAYLESHIPNAIFADLNTDLSDPDAIGQGRHPLPSPGVLNALFSSMGIDSDTQVIGYDSLGGSFASRLWWMLRYMNHEAVAVLDGGWQVWQQSGFPVSSGEEKNVPGDFHAQPRNEWLVTVDKISGAEMLIDSRDPARYRGELEPLDRIAGHIPGAKNHFWKDNLAENGLFKDPDDLCEVFQGILGTTLPQNAVFYCGSGVTACQNLLAAVHAGLETPRLYAGSWSEWCADPARPVATGEV